MSLIESEQELNKKINDLEELTPQGISEDDYIKGVIDNFNNVYLKNLRKSGGKERFTRDSEQPKFLPQKDRYLPRNFKYANKQESTNKNSDIMDIVQCKKFVNSVDESDVSEFDKKLLLFIFEKQLEQLNSINDEGEDESTENETEETKKRYPVKRITPEKGKCYEHAEYDVKEKDEDGNEKYYSYSQPKYVGLCTYMGAGQYGAIAKFENGEEKNIVHFSEEGKTCFNEIKCQDSQEGGKKKKRKTLKKRKTKKNKKKKSRKTKSKK